MKIYRLAAKDKFQKIILKHEPQWLEVMDQAVGKPIKNWKPVEAMMHDKTLNEGDYPTLMASIPTFSEKAVAVLKSQIEKDGQILPLLTDEGQYYFFNVLSIVDGLNETESDLIRIGSGKIVYIGKYVLKNNDYTKSHIFKLENLEKDSVFVTEAFKENIINNELQGFDFIEVDVC